MAAKLDADTVSRVTFQPGSWMPWCDRSLGLVQLLVASVQPAGCAAYQHLIVGLLLTKPYIRYAGSPFLVGHASGSIVMWIHLGSQ